MNYWYPTEGPQSVGPAGIRALQRPYCLDSVFFCENYSIKQGIYADFHSQNCRKVHVQPTYLFCICNNGM